MGNRHSPLSGGHSFDKTRFRNGGESLIKVLKKTDVLPDLAHGLEDLRLHLNGYFDHRSHQLYHIDSLEPIADVCAEFQ
jgi:hypothetical protein